MDLDKPTPNPAPAGATRSSRFAGQLAWNGVSFVTSLVAGFVLSPLVIRGVGIEAYGVWALVLSILEYLWIADLGVRAATVKYVAHYSALGDRVQLRRTLNASLLYFLCIAAVAAVLIVGGAKWSVGFFTIPEALRADYVTLMQLVGATMAAQLLFNIARAALEGIQDFGALSRINIVVSVLRTGGCLAVLYFGLGLVGLGWATVVAIWVSFLLLTWTFRRSFPDMVLSLRDFDWVTFRQLLHYGLPALIGTVSNQFLHFGPILILGILKDAASVGYYSLVLRLLSSIYEVISQAGSVTNSAVAQLSAQGDDSAVKRTVVYLNRYSFALFCFPLAFLLIAGEALFTRWVGPEVAAGCLPLLPWMVGAYALGAAAHQNSIATLFGLGIHKSHNVGVAVEALVLVGGWFLFVAERPLSFAAAWWSISFFLNRGLRPSWLVSRALHIPFPHLLASVYLRPLVIALATALVLVIWSRLMTPRNFLELGVMAGATGLVHLALCFAFVLAPEHRTTLTRFWTARRGAPGRGISR